MKYRVADLDGLLLEAAVALAEGHAIRRHPDPKYESAWLDETTGEIVEHYAQWWGAGGEIIERERISVCETSIPDSSWLAWIDGVPWEDDEPEGRGPTALIAAMRAFVVSRLGDEIELP